MLGGRCNSNNKCVPGNWFRDTLLHSNNNIVVYRRMESWRMQVQHGGWHGNVAPSTIVRLSIQPSNDGQLNWFSDHSVFPRRLLLFWEIRFNLEMQLPPHAGGGQVMEGNRPTYDVLMDDRTQLNWKRELFLRHFYYFLFYPSIPSPII